LVLEWKWCISWSNRSSWRHFIHH